MTDLSSMSKRFKVAPQSTPQSTPQSAPQSIPQPSNDSPIIQDMKLIEHIGNNMFLKCNAHGHIHKYTLPIDIIKCKSCNAAPHLIESRKYLEFIFEQPFCIEGEIIYNSNYKICTNKEKPSWLTIPQNDIRSVVRFMRIHKNKFPLIVRSRIS